MKFSVKKPKAASWSVGIHLNAKCQGERERQSGNVAVTEEKTLLMF